MFKKLYKYLFKSFFCSSARGEATKKDFKMKNKTHLSNIPKNPNDFYLIDADLLPVIKKANKGDNTAKLELIDAYSSGEKAPHDYNYAISYGLELAREYPRYIPHYKYKDKVLCYSSLFYGLGMMYEYEGEPKQALKWFNKSLDHAVNVHSSEIGDSFIKRHNLYERIEEVKQIIKANRKKYFKDLRDDFIMKFLWKRYIKKTRYSLGIYKDKE